MKFDFEYRTHENELKTGSISAPSREAVFATLKRQGINPSRVVLADGMLNAIAALGKRTLAIVLLCVALLAVLYLVYRNAGLGVLVGEEPTKGGASPLDAYRGIARQLKEAGRPQTEIDEFLNQLKKVEDDYRAKIMRRVKSGELTRKDAEALFRSMGLDEDGGVQKGPPPHLTGGGQL